MVTCRLTYLAALFVVGSSAYAQPEELRLHAYAQALNEVPKAESLRAWHDMLASEPHRAGTPGDLRVIESIDRAFRDMGLESEIHWIWPYLPHPVSAEVQIIAADGTVIDLPVTEPVVEGDPFGAHPALEIGANGYSGSGDVTAEVVYANHGRKQDFEKLAELGIDVRGKIVIARYGGNYRGYKAKFAEAAGAAGLIIYTDPAQSGYMRGLMYPEGGWATPHQIERGSLATLGYQGDPLTPGNEATEEAQRLDPATVDLPRIPVQPIGWDAAAQIMERMTGVGVPEESWQGAMPFPYRITGGAELRVRLRVQQDRRITKTANVIATLHGGEFPEELVILGCHHDAWGFGASDPTAGTIVLMEAAKSFAQLAEQGRRPRRTILFCAWGAEEQGIIGSSEWVERERDRLVKHGVAYINLDMAAMGPLFNASASPTLSTVISDATRMVPAARRPELLVFDEWLERARATASDEALATPSVGSMGGGSDHVGFYFHAGVPCLSLGGSGSRGTAYHSNYDSLHWYRMVVGEDYEPALMVTRVVNVVAAKLASSGKLPLDPNGIVTATRKHIDAIRKRAKELKVEADFTPIEQACDRLSKACTGPSNIFTDAHGNELGDADSIRQINTVLMSIERAWRSEAGLANRPWMKSMYMAPDEDSGYAAWPLPAIRRAIERRDGEALKAAVADLAARIDRIARSLATNPVTE